MRRFTLRHPCPPGRRTNQLVSLFTFFLVIGSVMSAFAQKVIVNGMVLDSSHEPLTGVTVAVKNSSNGTTTDSKGRYQLQANLGDSLVFSYLGYKTEARAVHANSTINVTLIASNQGLNEVVVVGYGEQKKASVVAAIATINADQIVQSPTSNIAVALAGRLPGLTVLQRSGEPGTNDIDLYLRGQSTLNDQKPLLMVDGVERNFNALDPHNIASISILKDASATAVYGVRGANGVILVTTKRGKAGENKINMTVDQSFQAPTFLPKMVSAYDYAVLANEVQANTGGQPAYSQEELEHYKSGDEPEKYPVRNFMDEFTKTFSPMTKVNANVSGGTSKMRYFTSVGFMLQKGLFKTDEDDSFKKEYDYDAESKDSRFNFRSNIDIDLNSTLSMYLNISGYLEKKNDPVVLPGSTADNYYLIMAKLLSTPNLAYNDLTPDGEVITSTKYAVGGATQTPYGYINRTGFKRTDRNNLTSTLGAQQKLDFITPGLSAKVAFSYDAFTVNQQVRSRSYAVYEASLQGDTVAYTKLGSSNNSALTDAQIESFNSMYDLDVSLNYARSFGNHDITAMALFNRNQKVINIELPYNYVGFVGRATYAYKNKYLAEANFGYNGSEQFAPGKQFGFFPSLALGWVASEEAFLKSSKVLDFLKFRFSIGQVGNDRMESSRFLYIDDWGTGGGWLGLPAGYYQNTMPNKDISWEVSTKSNIGINAIILNSFDIDFDVFYEIRNNILVRDAGSTPTGMFGQSNLPPLNSGKIRNQGFEAELGYHKQLNDKLSLLARINGAYTKNKVLYVDEVDLPEDYAYRTRQTGYSLGQMFGYKTAGFFTSEQEIAKWADQTPLGAPPQPGDLKYVDVNGDGVVDVKDQIPIGYPNVPQWTFGGSVSLTYGSFDLSLMVQGAANRSYYLNDRGTWETQGNFTEWHKEAWSKEKYENHQKITYPRLVPGGNSNHVANDFWIVNGSYIRLKNAELGFTLPHQITDQVRISKVRLYLSGFNLVTLDRFPKKYFDPELGNQLSYPIWKVYNVGLNISF